MTKQRYVFVGIPVICILLIIISLIVYQPKNNTEKKKERPTHTGLVKDNTPNSAAITQTVQDLSMPSYDEKGDEILVMRGENTILLNNNVYKIIAPEIEVMDSANTENGTQSVLITSDNGEMNNTSNEGFLTDNVVVHFDPETQLNTDYLRYLPEKKLVYTDYPVTINGNGVRITGQGCEIDLVNKKMWIKKDAEMEMDGIKNDLFFLARENEQQDVRDSGKNSILPGETSAKDSLPEKTVIRSSGQLIFDRQPDAQIMTFHDHVDVKKGATTVFSDKLVVFLDPVTKQTKQAIASGNVLASQGAKIAKGSFLTWDVNTQSAILEDAHKAEFIKEDLTIYGLKMIFYKDIGRIDVPTAGSLKAKSKGKKTLPGAEKTDDADIVHVVWEEKMVYAGDIREANFEKDVEVRKENSILFCEHLKVKFNDHDDNIQSLKGTENVHIINQRGGLYNEAVGDQVTWNARNKVSVLRGYPFAILKEGNTRQIFSPRVLFYEAGNNLLCEGKGSLYEKGEEANQPEDAEKTDIKVNWAKKMFYNDSLRRASFYDEVEITRGDQELDSDQTDAYMNSNQKITKIIANGNVYFSGKGLGGNEGLGSLLTWDLIQNAAVLTGKPKAELRKGDSRTFSEKVYFDMAKNRVTWEGRPHWMLLNK